MIRKTEGIVLNTRKFSESSLITTLFTSAYGKQSYFVKGYRSTRSKKRHSYFQPMSVIDIVFYHKDSRDLQTITESTNHIFFNRLQTDPVRITLGLLTVEVFDRVVKQQEPDEPLYIFLRETLVQLEKRDDRLIAVFIYYFLHLTGYLGFLPRDEAESEGQPVAFDMVNGCFVNGLATDKNAALASAALRQMLFADFDSCTTIVFDNAVKREMMDLLMQYYRIHIEGFRDPESLKVFEEVFG